MSSFAHLTLATRDVSRTAEFFVNTMQWRSIDRPGNIGQCAAWLAIGPDQELHLIEVAEFEPSPFEREYGRHFAFNYPLDKFDELKGRLVACGAELIDPERPTPFERFFFKDPNGYVFEIIESDRQPET